MRSALVAAVALVLGVVGPAAALPGHYGGTLVVGLNSGDPDSLDPTLFRNLSAVEIANTFCERLYVFNGRAQVVPQLAAADRSGRPPDHLSRASEHRRGDELLCDGSRAELRRAAARRVRAVPIALRRFP